MAARRTLLRRPLRRLGETDREYNLRRRKEQERIDEILDKVRRSGYASLTEEEKKDLFNHTRRP